MVMVACVLFYIRLVYDFTLDQSFFTFKFYLSKLASPSSQSMRGAGHPTPASLSIPGPPFPETAASLGAPCRPLRLAFCYTQLAVGAAPAAITRALITAEGPTTTWRAAPTLLLTFCQSLKKCYQA